MNDDIRKCCNSCERFSPLCDWQIDSDAEGEVAVCPLCGYNERNDVPVTANFYGWINDTIEALAKKRLSESEKQVDCYSCGSQGTLKVRIVDKASGRHPFVRGWCPKCKFSFMT